MMDNTFQHIADEVRRFLATEVRPNRNPEFYDDDRALISSGLLDSVAMARLITFLEGSRDVEFYAHELSVQYMDNVGMIANTVLEKLGEA